MTHPTVLDDSNPVLSTLIAQAIRERGPLTFAAFMDLVLYHPEHGYYATNQANIGAGGDFYTAPHLGADFGELLAEQCVDMWQALEQPPAFTLVEMGAGQGLLSRDLLAYLQKNHPDLWAVLNYVILERSPALILEQQQRLQPFATHVRWLSWENLPPVTGCFFSNELVDAFAVHRFVVRGRVLQELYVTLGSDGTLQQMAGELSTPRLSRYFDLVGIDPSQFPEDYTSEVNLAALDWLSQVAAHLERGYCLTIDYGYPAHRYYQPTRTTGTLLCYYRHTANSNPYHHIGRQDLTTHVDFTALERHGATVGLMPLGFTQQALFLMALGLGDRLNQLLAQDALSWTEGLRRHQALHTLIHPTGMGQFGVLLQAKGLSASQQTHPLKGLQTPLQISFR
ncbi:class I SAM-dependent methyltransferase [Anthocerotibacter panamensis]|uniref:class I SAM-dependent methyltransferase n=1 Tax=Anthocerotibacter panamensis TaxID=2857077 RepID=UPI001C407D31|nr:class I SAM-dependent methyltransferase [Anthocerotibacter panamensis]